MGIIIRNGIPYGAADSKDITVVDRYSDLANLAVKQADHIYVVKNALQTTQSGYPHAQSFYYDESIEGFKPIAEITGQANQILVATGPTGTTHQLANWAHQNSISFFAEATQSTGTSPGSPTEFTIGSKISSNVYPVAFGHIGDSITTPAALSSLKSGYLTRDSAKQKIAGTAQVNIGEDNANYTSDNRKFWSKELTGPRIDIGGTAIIEMEGTGKGSSDSDTPVLSMRGRCLVDMCGSRPTASQEVGYGRARTASWWPHAMDSYEYDPFDPTKYLNNNTVAYPYLHMHDESTILMDGAPILNMRGNSMLSINGDVCIDINGRNPVNRPSFPGAAAGYGDVAIDIRPGTAIQIGTGNESTSSNPTTSMIRLNRQQLVVACALPKETNVSSSSCISQLYMDTTNGYVTSYESELFPFKHEAVSGNTSGIFNFYDSSAFTKWDASTMNSKIGQWAYTGVWGEGPGKNIGPVVWMQGKSRIKIGDGGTFSAALGGLGNVSISMEPYAGSSTEIYMASASYSADVINIANESNSFTTFHHGAAPQAATKYEFTPAGNTMFRFSPRTKFFMNVDSYNTEMLLQWKSMYGFFQGDNNYALLDGKQTHLENVGNTFIMRDDTTSEIYAEREGQDTSTTIYKFRHYYDPTTTKNVIVDSLPTNEADFASTTLAQDAMTTFNNNKSSLPESSNIHGAVPEFFSTDNYGSRNDTQYYNPYNQNCCRYWTEEYPIEASLYVGYSDTAAVQFDSTTAFSGTTDTTSWKYLSTSSYYTAILSDADFLAAVRAQLGDLAQYFHSVPYNNIYYKRSATANGYHYMICYCYVRLRQTFTRDEFFHNSNNGPSPVTSGTIINSNYAIYPQVTAAYASANIPTGWSLTTSTSTSSGDNRIHLYANSTPIGENKWNRGARVRYSTDPQDSVAWSQPVQTGESGDTKPVFQMYNRSNFMMRADTIFKPFYNEYVQRPLTTLETYEFTPTDTYTGLTTETIVVHTTTSYYSIKEFLMSVDYQTFVEAVETQYPGDTVAGVISWSKASASGGGYNNTIVFVLASVRRACELEIATFINSADYTAFTTYLTTQYPSKELWRIAYLQAGEDNKFVVYFGLKDAGVTEFLKDPSGDEPIFEMVGKSQLRMYNGAYIKGESKNGETVFTFGSTTTGEAPVSFTLAELAAAISGGGNLPNAADAQF